MLTPTRTRAPATATYYAPGLGSCGHFNTEADFIVAVDIATIQSFPGATANPNAYVPRPPLLFPFLFLFLRNALTCMMRARTTATPCAAGR